MCGAAADIPAVPPSVVGAPWPGGAEPEPPPCPGGGRVTLEVHGLFPGLWQWREMGDY